VIDAALTALHAHVSDAALVSSAMKLLCLCADPCAEALRLATGVRVVQATEAAMRAHAGLSALQVAGVRVFGAWYHRCEALLHEVVDAGGIESSVAVMHAFAADADTQIAGLYVLLDVVRHVAPMDPLVNRIVNAGALPVVSASMRTNVNDETILTSCCGFLTRLLQSGDDALGAAVVACGAVPAVLGALHTHADCANMQLFGCLALLNIAGAHQDHDATMAGSGAVGAVLSALTRHKADAEVQRAACAALSTMTYGPMSDAVNAEAVRLGCLEAVSAAMARPAAEPKMLHAGCNFIEQVSACEAHAARAGAAGAVEAVVGVMRRHPNDEEVCIATCLALDALLTFCDANAHKAQRAGAAPLVEAVMRQCQDEECINSCANVMKMMQRLSADADAAMAALLAEEEAEHAARRAAPAAAKGKGKSKSKSKKKGGKGGAAAASGARAVSRSRSRSASPDASPEEAGGGAAALDDALDAPDIYRRGHFWRVFETLSLYRKTGVDPQARPTSRHVPRNRR
jgi:hypothetical protein